MTGDPTNRRNLVTILRAAEARDPVTNELKSTWGTLRQAWVSIEPRRGQERFRDGSQEATVSHIVRGHYYDLEGVTAKDRVLFGSRLFDIEAVMLDESYHMDGMLAVLETDEPYEAP